MPSSDGGLGGGLGGHRGVRVPGEDEHRRGTGGVGGLEQVACRRPSAGAGLHHHGTRLAEQPGHAGAGRARDDGEGAGRLASGHLAVEVGDPDPFGPPRGDPCLDRGAGVVDVHVDVPQVRPADDEQRVAQGVEGAGERHDGLPRAAGQQVHHLEGGSLGRGRGVVVERVGAGVAEAPRGRGRAPLVAAAQGGPGREQALVGAAPGARDDAVQRLEHEHAPGTPGVDHPGTRQRGQLLGRTGQGLPSGLDGTGADLAQVGPRVDAAAGCGRRGVGDAEDGALLRVRDRGAGGRRPPFQAGGEHGGVDRLGVTVEDLVAEPADDLAGDDPGVAACREQDGPPERAALLDEGGLPEDASCLVRGDDVVDGAVEGEVEVGAGVAVGHREDVELVDLGAPGGERRAGQDGPVPGVGGGEHVGHAGQGIGRTPRAPGAVLAGRVRLGYACPVARAPRGAAPSTIISYS